MKRLIRRLLGESTIGRLEYYFKKERQFSLGGPFNGQVERHKIYSEILATVQPHFIVETGTCRGETTEFLAKQAEIPVYSVESHPRDFAYSSLRLRDTPNIHLFHDDSVNFLRWLPAEIRGSKEKTGLFYLDAHWGETLPVLEELRIIVGNWARHIVMIDDFKVPNDPGYGYDDYGGKGCLCISFLNQLGLPSPHYYFPQALSQQETGAKRGCVIVTFSDQVDSIVASMKSVSKHESVD